MTQAELALIKRKRKLSEKEIIHLEQPRNDAEEKEAVDKIAQIAYDVNQGTDNIGARRLSTILEKLLEDVLYEGPDMEMGEITITEAYVEDKLSDIITNKDLTKFIL